MNEEIKITKAIVEAELEAIEKRKKELEKIQRDCKSILADDLLEKAKSYKEAIDKIISAMRADGIKVCTHTSSCKYVYNLTSTDIRKSKDGMGVYFDFYSDTGRYC